VDSLEVYMGGDGAVVVDTVVSVTSSDVESGFSVHFESQSL